MANIDKSMIDSLRLVSLALAKRVETLRKRTTFEDLNTALSRKPRLKLLKGFRGLGKTTLLLQMLNEDIPNRFYFSADHPLAKEFGIYAVSKEVIRSGFMVILIDEIHTYPKWREEIKALNDEFPDLVIFASGSAPLALNPERREELIEIKPMDFAEYLSINKNLELKSENEWKDKQLAIAFIASNPSIESEFYKYARCSAFPSSLELDEERALDAIYHSIKKSIREDAVFFLNMSKEKVFGMENILIFLATASLGELSINAIAKSLELSKTVVYEIINTLETMEIIHIIRPYKKGLALVRAEPKMMFRHPNFRYAICKQLGKDVDIGSIREELAVFSFTERGFFVSTIKGMKKSPDYIIERNEEKFIAEIGGEGKTKAQLKGFENGIVLTEYQLIPLSLVKSK